MSFYEMSGIAQHECKQAIALKTALSRSRKAVSKSDYRSLKDRNREDYHAANRYSRCVFGEAVCEQVEKAFCPDFSSHDHDRDIFFVTLLDIRCATELSNVNPAIDYFKRIMRGDLKCMSYLGFMDVAHYSNLAAGVRFNGKRCLFWHVHALVWGLSKSQMKKRVRVMNQSGQYLAIADGLKGALAKKVRPGTLPRVVGYILKSPANSYRVSRKDRFDEMGKPLIDQDGEVMAKFRQRKGELRPSERVRLFHLMKNASLADLAISGGEGRPMLARAKRAAFA